jgi:hypothetical protein
MPVVKPDDQPPPYSRIVGVAIRPVKLEFPEVELPTIVKHPALELKEFHVSYLLP